MFSLNIFVQQWEAYGSLCDEYFTAFDKSESISKMFMFLTDKVEGIPKEDRLGRIAILESENQRDEIQYKKQTDE